MTAVGTLSAADFALTFSTRAPRLAWFIGAGCSAAAGIPTGYDMIVDFKARLFCRDTSLPRREIDAADPLWIERICEHFDAKRGMPANGHPSEYSAFFEAVYPDPADRRTYIEQQIRRGAPSFGHRVLAACVASRRAPAIFTSNFDRLIENSSTEADALLDPKDQARLATSDLNAVDVAERCVTEGAWPLLVKLHGDYQSEGLKNIDAELAHQDEALRRVLITTCRRFGLVIAGYSGRDQSVMDALTSVLDDPMESFPGGLFWIVRHGVEPRPAVTDFLGVAATRGVDVHTVVSENFDELMGALERQLDLTSPLDDHVRASRPAARVVPVRLPTVDAQEFPVLRTSGLPLLSIPIVARRITLSTPAPLADLREAVKAAGVRGRVALATTGSGVAAFCRDAELVAALASFGPTLVGEIALDPTNDSWALGLLYEALTKALARGRPIRPVLSDRRGHALISTSPPAERQDDQTREDRRLLSNLEKAYRDRLFGTVPRVGRRYAEAIDVHLEFWLDRWWCVVDPFTWVERSVSVGEMGPRRDPDIEALADWRRERWARRYNNAWNNIIDGWAHLLISDKESTISALGIGESEGIDAEFTVRQTSGWCRPGRFTLEERR
jgi:hypothetical protein